VPTVYGVIASPFVRKVRAVLAEKGVAYELESIIPVNVPPEYRQISPLGKVPAFRDGDRTLADSSVICAYLERVHPEPRLYPSEPYEYARALWFEEYGDTALAETLTGAIFFHRIVAPRFLGRPTDDAAVDTAIETRVPPLFDYLERQLASRDFLVGTGVSIGDLAVATHFVNLRHAGFRVDERRWPALARYVTRVLGRASFARLIDEEENMLGRAA
jgi:glutathione S-transferase